MFFLKNIGIYWLIVVCIITTGYAQNSKTYSTKINKANNVYIGKNLSDAQRASVLLVSKYIKKDMPIFVICGANTSRYTYETIKKGAKVFTGDAENILKLEIKNNNLYINSRIKGIDQKLLAVIKDNKLIVNKGLILRSSEKFIEIIDDYDIPVLQVVLQEGNRIEVNGLFFSEQGYVMFSPSGMYVDTFDKPFVLMDDSEKRKTLYSIRNYARVLKPIK